MTPDILANIILSITRILTLFLSAVILFNLSADWRNAFQEERRNGVWQTRITLVVLMLALVIENLVYTLGYLHGRFNTDGLNAWLAAAKPFVVVARILILVAVITIYRLFCCNHKKKE